LKPRFLWGVAPKAPDCGRGIFPQNLQIPTQAGHLFRFDRGHHSDLKPATYSDLIAATIPI